MNATSTLETLPDRIRPHLASNLLLVSIGAFLLLFLLWAAFAELDVVSRGVGRVIPSRQLQIVSNLEGGIVKEILVRQGQEVSKGQVLIRLDKTQLSADFGRDEENVNALAARIARLQAEVEGRPLVFSAELQRAAPELVAAERTLYAARRMELAAAVSASQSRLEQARRALAEAEVAVGNKSNAAALASRELEMVRPLVRKGIEPQISLVRAESALAQAEGENRASQLAVQRARAAVSEAQHELESVRERYHTEAVDQLTAAKSEVAAKGRTLEALEDRVTRTEVRSPIAGTVNRVLVATVGGIVRPGEPLVEVVPRDDTLIVEAEVKPSDIGFIHPGQKALVKLTAYDYAIYGGLEGKVERISPDAVKNERTGETHYLVQVRTEKSGIEAADGSQLPIGPGMVAEVDVLGDKRSVLSYILTPITRLQERALRER